MNKYLVATGFLFIALLGFSQKFGTLLVSDDDMPGESVEGVAIYLGKELLGTTNHVGSFHFPRKVKGTITLTHAGYVSKDLKVRTKADQVVETGMQMDQASYDAMKAIVGPRIYEKCMPQNVKVVPVASAGSAVSEKGLQEYIQSVMLYPKRASENGEQGTVIMQFKIDTEGLIACLEIAQGATFELDREAYRILAGMPQWEPAKRNGTPVAAYYSVPVVFQLK